VYGVARRTAANARYTSSAATLALRSGGKEQESHDRQTQVPQTRNMSDKEETGGTGDVVENEEGGEEMDEEVFMDFAVRNLD
jgi:hypothetical protein